MKRLATIAFLFFVGYFLADFAHNTCQTRQSIERAERITEMELAAERADISDCDWLPCE